MRRGSFEALALPRGLEPPPGPVLDLGPNGGGVRFREATPAWVEGVAGRLRDAREGLAARPVAEIVGALGHVGARFLDLADPLRDEALALLPTASGLSAEMAELVLDGMAADWTEARLQRLVRSELGCLAALDGFTRAEEGEAMAVGPALCVQIVAGSVPGVGVHALLRSLLVKGPTLLKPGRGDVVLPALFARALARVDEGLADAAAVVYWPGGSSELEEAALAGAEVVTAYGSDETVGALRARTPVTARFVAYHHRVSVGVVGRGALGSEAEVEAAARDVAAAVAAFDQRGCVSPQVVYVEEGGAFPAIDFARALARALADLQDRLPVGRLDTAEASALHQARGTAELMGAKRGAELFHGGDASWTVLYGREPVALAATVGRVIRVHEVADAGDVPGLLRPLGRHLQTVGTAGLGERIEGTARALGLVGASRVAPFGSVTFPPPWWHHDGRGPLLDLVRWVDLERG